MNNTSYNYTSTSRTSYSTGNDGRYKEKEELQALEGKLGKLLARLQSVREQSTNIDTSGFAREVRKLEDEIKDLQTTYERELANLRQENENVAMEKNRLHVLADKNAGQSKELQDRLAQEADKNRRLGNELNNLQAALIQKEKEVQQAQAAMNGPIDELHDLQRALEQAQRDAETHKRRHDSEQEARMGLEERLKALLNEHEFCKSVNKKTEGDLKDRLDGSTAHILELEAKIRELGHTENNLPAQLKRVQDAAAEELRCYKEESEAEFGKNLKILQSEIDKQNRTIAELSNENRKLEEIIDELNSKLANLQGTLNGLRHENKTLEDSLRAERARGAKNIDDLQAKLAQLQANYVKMVQENTNNRENVLPLKTEIEALKALIEDEERRLSKSGNAASASRTLPELTKSYTSMPLVSGISRSNTNANMASSPSNQRMAMTSTYKTQYKDEYCKQTKSAPDFAAMKQEASLYLNRPKMETTSYAPEKHPHGQNPSRPVHPSTGGGNGYGATGQRMGSGSLKKSYNVTTVRGSGSLANKADYMSSSPSPKNFTVRLGTGSRRVDTQYHDAYRTPAW